MNELEMVAYFLSEYDQKTFSALDYSPVLPALNELRLLYGK